MVQLDWSCSEAKDHLVFHFILWWSFCCKPNHVAQVEGEKVHTEASFVKEFLDGFPVIQKLMINYQFFKKDKS